MRFLSSENAHAGIMVAAMSDSKRNEALAVVDNQLNRNCYFGFAANGGGTTSFSASAARWRLALES